MPDDAVDVEKCILIPHSFNEVDIVAVEYDGQPVFLAQQVALALGYTDPKTLSSNLTQRWSEDLVEGQDYIKLSGPELARFKAAVDWCADRAPVPVDKCADRALVDPRARHLILLTESGAQLVAMLSRTPQGRAFRRWLVDVVLPAFRARKAPPVRAHRDQTWAPVPETLEDAPAGLVAELLAAERCLGRELLRLRGLVAEARGRRRARGGLVPVELVQAGGWADAMRVINRMPVRGAARALEGLSREDLVLGRVQMSLLFFWDEQAVAELTDFMVERGLHLDHGHREAFNAAATRPRLVDREAPQARRRPA